jgi:hypothetical protein
VSSQKIEGAELSRPRRQFKEDRKAHNKPQGRKRKILQQQARRMNWKSPFVWAQIEIAARKAGKPWSPRAILKEAQKLDPVIFAGLTEQVIGRWIDPTAKRQGVSKWTSTVLDQVKAGNSPNGQSTRQGILVCNPSLRIQLCIKTIPLIGTLPRHSQQD